MENINIIQNSTQYLSSAILIIGLLAFGVSIIVQVIKALPGLNKIPTNVVVFALAIMLSMVAFFVYADITEMKIFWYYIVAVVMLGFFVAYIAMFGWDKFNELYKRFVRKDE